MILYLIVLFALFILFFKSIFVFARLDVFLLFLGVSVTYFAFFCLIVENLFSRRRIDKLSILVLLPIAVVTVVLLISLQLETVVSIKAAIESYVLLTFPFIIFFLLSRLEYKYLRLVKKNTIIFIFILVFFSFVELLLPKDFIFSLGGYFLTLKTGIETVQNAYFVRDFILPVNVFRTGSILFEPVTYSILCLLSFGLFSRFRLAVFLSLLTTLGKSAIFGYLIALIIDFFPRWRILFVSMFLVLFVLLILNLENILNVIPHTSMGLHVIGLINGLLSLNGNILFGNGLGSAGYGAYLEAKNLGLLSVYFDTDVAAGVSNGNESFIGILMFQLGLIPFILYLFPFVYGLIYFFKSKKKMLFSLLSAFFLISFLTETVSSILLLSIVSLLFVLSIKEKQTMASLYE